MCEAVSGFNGRVSRVVLGDREIFIVGTAHLSNESVEDVRNAVAVVKPDTICIELCQGRYKSLVEKDNWKKMNIFRIIRERKSAFLLAQLIMSSFYRRLGEKLGIEPGAEMLEGVKQASETGAELVLADRNIEITLKRVWGYLGFFNKMKLMFQLLLALFETDEIDTEQIEQLKQSDQLAAAMETFAGKFPEIKHRLLDERDIYLAQKIRQAPGKKIVAVVGAGHVGGILEHIQEDESLDELMVIPPKSVWPRVLKWAIPAAILGIIILGFFKNGAAHSVENIYIWILVNGIFSAIGAAVALAHPLTILASFIAAPLTSLNPMIAAGWVAGIVQAWIVRPTVADFEDLPVAIKTFKGFWKNPVTKILLVVALANLGSGLGTYISAAWIATRSF